MQTPSSLSLFRHRTPTFFRHHPLLITASRHHQNQPNVSRKQPPSKNLLKAKKNLTSKKDFSNLSPILSPDHTPTNLSDSQAIGTVAASQANFMRVIVTAEPEKIEDSSSSSSKVGTELLCVVRAVLKKIKRRVLVGDKVVVGSIDWVDRRGMIENVFQRSSDILDPPVANVDRLLVLFSVEQPQLESFVLTRFLIEAESTGIPITLALNKAELVDQQVLSDWDTRLRSWGYEPLFCSVDSKMGLDSLASVLRDQTTVIVGPSGVGKSSLINALRNKPNSQVEVDNWFDPIMGSKWFEDQRVGKVSTRSGRGKHTTRNVSLLPLGGGGYLADTPGFSQPSLLKVTKQSLAQYFPEIRKMLGDNEQAKCAFNDCLHVGEPGCIVKGDWERYPLYFQLLDEIRIREEFQLRTFGTKREDDVRYKVGDMGVKQAEPRLEPKKHRRQSRKRINQSILDELNELDDDEDLLDDENDPILRALKNENL
ncbi:small ribosomal subunit biogenesis GTPase RsgA 1, mitochondrial-like isoform X1 [Populus nigra]|uniref:small ribosomal subunit biogenesis GTPase RsgA 1, mitochondrial-like isoform X1 n=1 Tax=Populus nigra TaxID=3691 RepID=UPI002B2724FA|nr:small ribosomal subunit biogenesis GTPase RsgA 1, mitochondrial-like isoform X1 [Populus nigra]